MFPERRDGPKGKPRIRGGLREQSWLSWRGLVCAYHVRVLGASCDDDGCLCTDYCTVRLVRRCFFVQRATKSYNVKQMMHACLVRYSRHKLTAKTIAASIDQEIIYTEAKRQMYTLSIDKCRFCGNPVLTMPSALGTAIDWSGRPRRPPTGFADLSWLP